MKPQTVKYKENSMKYMMANMFLNFIKMVIIVSISFYLLSEVKHLTACMNTERFDKLINVLENLLLSIGLLTFTLYQWSEYIFYKKTNYEIAEVKVNVNIKTIFYKRDKSFKYANLQHIDLEQNIIEKLFGLKTLIAYTSSGESSNLILKNIEEKEADEYFLFLENEILKNEK
jgi:membrane protein YdbS with pleckstrin-like domain